MDGMSISTGMAMPTSTAMSMGMGSMTSTASAAMASSTGMDMGMDMGSGSSCKVSMLWNWNTIDACFLAKSWHITSHGMFGGSCIGVICLVILLEFLRRVGREYDAYIVRRTNVRRQLAAAVTTPQGEGSGSRSSNDGDGTAKPGASVAVGAVDTGPVRPTLFEQLVRAALHMVQFAVAYFVMLLAMYYNGYIIICIFIGAFLGAFIFSWEPLGAGKEPDATQVTKCCG